MLCQYQEELIHRMFSAQKRIPSKGDWFDTIKKDFRLINEKIEDYDSATIISMKFNTYKKFMKKKIKEAAFNFLDNSKKSQSKLHHQEYKSLTAQKFLKSGKFLNEEVYLLSKLKSRNTPVKENFKGLHSDTL